MKLYRKIKFLFLAFFVISAQLYLPALYGF